MMYTTLSMAQESVPSVDLVMLGCMVVISWIVARSVSVCVYMLARHDSE